LAGYIITYRPKLSHLEGTKTIGHGTCAIYRGVSHLKELKTIRQYYCSTYKPFCFTWKTLGLLVRPFGILASLLLTSKAFDLIGRVLDMLSIPIAPFGRHQTYWVGY
jgi:hypothetical protein